MAGKGPPPGENTRRRNKKTTEELPAEGHQGRYPALPRSYRTEVDGKVRKVDFLKPTRDWYLAWARSPMAIKFTAVDWQRLMRVARVVDQYERHPDPKLIAEVRLQEAGFGGTPYDRQRLGIKIKTGGPEQEPQPDKPARRRPSARRGRLSVVK